MCCASEQILTLGHKLTAATRASSSIFSRLVLCCALRGHAFEAFVQISVALLWAENGITKLPNVCINLISRQCFHCDNILPIQHERLRSILKNCEFKINWYVWKTYFSTPNCKWNVIPHHALCFWAHGPTVLVSSFFEVKYETESALVVLFFSPISQPDFLPFIWKTVHGLQKLSHGINNQQRVNKSFQP